MLSITDDEHLNTPDSHRLRKPGEGMLGMTFWTHALFFFFLAFSNICLAILTVTFSLHFLETSGMEDRFASATFYLLFPSGQHQNELKG